MGPPACSLGDSENRQIESTTYTDLDNKQHTTNPINMLWPYPPEPSPGDVPDCVKEGGTCTNIIKSKSMPTFTMNTPASTKDTITPPTYTDISKAWSDISTEFSIANPSSTPQLGAAPSGNYFYDQFYSFITDNGRSSRSISNDVSTITLFNNLDLTTVYNASGNLKIHCSIPTSENDVPNYAAIVINTEHSASAATTPSNDAILMRILTNFISDPDFITYYHYDGKLNDNSNGVPIINLHTAVMSTANGSSASSAIDNVKDNVNSILDEAKEKVDAASPTGSSTSTVVNGSSSGELTAINGGMIKGTPNLCWNWNIGRSLSMENARQIANHYIKQFNHLIDYVITNDLRMPDPTFSSLLLSLFANDTGKIYAHANGTLLLPSLINWISSNSDGNNHAVSHCAYIGKGSLIFPVDENTTTPWEEIIKFDTEATSTSPMIYVPYDINGKMIRSPNNYPFYRAAYSPSVVASPTDTTNMLENIPFNFTFDRFAHSEHTTAISNMKYAQRIPGKYIEDKKTYSIEYTDIITINPSDHTEINEGSRFTFDAPTMFKIGKVPIMNIRPLVRVHGLTHYSTKHPWCKECRRDTSVETGHDSVNAFIGEADGFKDIIIDRFMDESPAYSEGTRFRPLIAKYSHKLTRDHGFPLTPTDYANIVLTDRKKVVVKGFNMKRPTKPILYRAHQSGTNDTKNSLERTYTLPVWNEINNYKSGTCSGGGASWADWQKVNGSNGKLTSLSETKKACTKVTLEQILNREAGDTYNKLMGSTRLSAIDGERNKFMYTGPAGNEPNGTNGFKGEKYEYMQTLTDVKLEVTFTYKCPGAQYIGTFGTERLPVTTNGDSLNVYKAHENLICMFNTLADLYQFNDETFKAWVTIVRNVNCQQLILNAIREYVGKHLEMVVVNKINNQIGDYARELGSDVTFINSPLGPPLLTVPNSYVVEYKGYFPTFSVKADVDANLKTYDLKSECCDVVTRTECTTSNNYLDVVFKSIIDNAVTLNHTFGPDTYIASLIPSRGHQLFEAIDRSIVSLIPSTYTTIVDKLSNTDKMKSVVYDYEIPKILVTFMDLSTDDRYNTLTTAYRFITSVHVPVMSFTRKGTFIDVDINTSSVDAGNIAYVYVSADNSQELVAGLRGAGTNDTDKNVDKNNVNHTMVNIQYNGLDSDVTPTCLQLHFA